MPPSYTQNQSKDQLTAAVNAMLSQYLEPVSDAVIEHGGTFELQFSIDDVTQTSNGFSLTNLHLSIKATW